MNGDPKPHYKSSKKGTKSLLTSRPSVNSFCIGGSVGEARGARPQLTFRPNWSSQGKAKSHFNKEYVAFSWKNWKFWLENQMLRTILFAGSFSCSICLIFPCWLICMLCSGLFSHHVKFYTFMFMIKISPRVVGKPPQGLFFVSVWISGPPLSWSSESITGFWTANDVLNNVVWNILIWRWHLLTVGTSLHAHHWGTSCAVWSPYVSSELVFSRLPWLSFSNGDCDWLWIWLGGIWGLLGGGSLEKIKRF